MKKQREFDAPREGYNYFRTMGWVIILQDNKPINYYADHGELDEHYLAVDEIFKTMCDTLKETVNIVDIIMLKNTLNDVARSQFGVDLNK